MGVLPINWDSTISGVVVDQWLAHLKEVSPSWRVMPEMIAFKNKASKDVVLFN